MNEPPDPEDDTLDLNAIVMESAALLNVSPASAVPSMGWEEPVGSAGFRAVIPPDGDSEDIARQLVEAGNEEAGREQRLAADGPTPLD